jgi:hypothetical protein
MKSLFLCIAILIATITQAKEYYQCVALLSNGKTIEGFAEFPSNKMFDKSVKFRATLDSKSEKIDDDDIFQIRYFKDGKMYSFERNGYRMAAKLKKGVKEKVLKSRYWYLIMKENEHIIYYALGEKYDINKKGLMVITAESTQSTPSGGISEIHFLLKRPNEKVPTLIAMNHYGTQTIGLNKVFRKYASTYFSDNAEMVRRIEAKEFKNKDMDDLVDTYVLIMNRNKPSE